MLINASEMTKNSNKKSVAATLRQKAEELLLAKKSSQTSSLSDGEMLKLIHELQVHQVELQLQNDELLEAKEAAEAATIKFTTLYDFAPTAYYTLARDGKIIELNLTGAKLLGKERLYIKNRQLGIYITIEDRPVFNKFLNNIFESKTKQSCEIALLTENKITTYVYLTGIVAEKDEYCLLTGVDITERKKAEAELKENNARLNLAMQAANMAWWEMDVRTGNIIFNEKKTEMLGYLPENFKHYSDFTKLIHPDDLDKAMNAMFGHIHGELEKYEVEYRIQTKSGDYKWFYDIGSIVKRSPDGSPLNVTGLVFDISERKLAEKALRMSEKSYRMLFENSGTGVVIINREGKFLMVNKKSATQFGCAPKEIIGKSLFDFLPQQTAQKYLEFNNSLLEKGGHREYEDIFVLNGKQKAFFIIDQCMKDENGNNVAIQSSSVDITDRKNTEEQLKKVQQLLAETEIIGKVGGWEFNIDTMRLIWTDEVYNIHEVDFNYDPNVDEGINFYTNESKPIIAQAVQRVMELGEPYDLELEIITAKGNLRKVHSIGKADFKQRRVYGFFQDITDRKLKEEELAFQARLLSEVNDAVFSSDCNFRINYWNQAAEKMFGWTTEEAVGKNSGELLNPKIKGSSRDQERLKLFNNGYWEGEVQYLRKDGTYILVEVNSSLLRDDNMTSTGQLIVCRDITERKLAEEAIKRSETILKLFVEHSPAAIAMFDLNMKYIVTSNRYLIDYDLGGQNLIGKSHYEVFPEIPERWKAIHNRCLSGMTERCEEDPFARANGKIDWIRWEICPWYETDGIIGGIILFSEVITESKIAEQSLQKSEEIWQKLVNTSPEFIAILDIDGNYQYLNRFAEGFSLKDISGKKAVDFIAHKSRETFLAKFEECRLSQQTQQFEYDALSHNGIISTYEGYLVPLLEQSKVASVMSIANDITERKKSEEKISASEVRYRRLFESAKDGILILDAETGIIVDVNPFLITMLYYSHDVFLGKKIWEIGSFKDVIKNKANFLELQQKEYIRYEDLPLETADGQTIHVEFISNVYYVNNQKVIQCNIRDITDRKIAERQISESREQLAQLYKHLNEVREEERTSIAREIHDDLGQSLAGLKIDLLGIKEDIHDKVCQTPKINKAISLVETTIKSAQKLTSQLRPQMLDELGLASAIEWQSNEFRKRTGVKCTLDLEEIDDIAENIAISLFRIFQASLTNIMLHSKAKSISVKLELKENVIYLSVTDDGIGITSEQLKSSKSFGIIGMRERANQINGKFEINTKINVGTEVTVSVPLSRR